MMAQMCLLAAMLIMCSVSGHVRDNLRNEAEAGSSMNDNINNHRRQAPTVCGSRPGFIDEEYGISTDFDDSDHLDKIVGGSFVKPGEFPWQARIYHQHPKPVCGGVIINNFWILTAAECVHNVSSVCQVRVVVGSDFLKTDVNGSKDLEKSYSVAAILIHRNYNFTRGYEYDIALIQVANLGPIEFNNKIQPICLPEPGELVPTDTELILSGWGEYSPGNDRIPDGLKKVVLPVIDHTVCSTEVYPRLITDGMLCAGEVNGNTDACLRDKGGPAVYKSGDVYVLAGITVGGTGCRLPNFPVIFSSVSMYRQWIDNVIINFGPGGLEDTVRV